MNKMRTRKRISMLKEVLLFLFFIVCAASVAAAEPETGEEPSQAQKVSEVSVKTMEERKAEWLRLKKEDPEGFRRSIQEKRRSIRERLERLKETDPQKHQEIMEKIRQRRLERLKRLKEENPQEFKRLIERGRGHLEERLEFLKEKDPERYKKIMALKEEMMRLRALKEDNPQEFQEYLQRHPEVRERLEKGRRRGGSRF